MMYYNKHFYIGFVGGSLLGFILGCNFYKRYYPNTYQVYIEENDHLKRAQQILDENQ
jgi:hypothetical protein